RVPGEPQPAQELSTARVGCRPANDGEEPGLERRPSIEARPSLKNLQVDGLKNVLGLGCVARAATQRPAVALSLASLQPRPQLRTIHSLRVRRIHSSHS